MNATTTKMIFLYGGAMIATTLFAIIGRHIVTVLVDMQFFDTPPVHDDEGCVLVRNSPPGSSEDQTRFDKNSLLLTDWWVLDCLPGEDRPGFMHVASGFDNADGVGKSPEEFVRSGLLQIKKLPMENYPEGVGFHPHGMYVHKPTDTLYVINHAYEKGGERIDVFAIGADDSGIPNTLIYEYSITNEWMQKELNGILNALVVVAPNKFCVTQWNEHAHDRSTDGPIGIEHKALLDLGRVLLFKPKATRVLYCEFKPNNDGGSPNCETVADGFVCANGIARDSDCSKIFVADSFENSVSVFGRNPETHQPENRTAVEVPGSVDNLKFDDESNTLYGAGITNLFNSYRDYGLYKNECDTETATSGIYELSLNDDAETTPPSVKRILSTHKLNHGTNGVRMGDYLVMGSGVSTSGFLVCPATDNAGIRCILLQG